MHINWTEILIYFILISIVLFFINKFLSRFKFPKIGALAVVNGGVKTGKSTFAVALAIKEYKRNLRSVKFSNWFARLFKKPEQEQPLLYSNIPLAVPYVQLTKDLLLRKKRFRYRSIIYINEASLLADSKTLNNEEVNTQLLLYFKLIGHETKGGAVILDTHTIADLHYAEKRTTSEYFYIHHLTKWIPFFLIAYVQECRYSDDNSTIFAQNQDIEDTLKRVIIRKKTWKYFDAYSYSALTDTLPIEEKIIENATDLKARQIISFKPEYQDINAILRRTAKNEKKNS